MSTSKSKSFLRTRLAIAALAVFTPVLMAPSAHADQPGTRTQQQELAPHATRTAPADPTARRVPPAAMFAGKSAALAAVDVTAGWEKVRPNADGLVRIGKWTIDPATGVQSAPNATSADCLNGYACWFGGINYSGWIQRYKDVYRAAKIAYNDQMSSWWNRRCGDSEWNDGNFIETTYSMPRGQYFSYVGDKANDTMTYFSNFAC